MEQSAAGRWVAGATPLEIGKEVPLEAVAEAPLELVKERDWMVWALSIGVVVSSSGRGRGVG